ncbi:hypothetical protein K438DRAFT_1724845 [Mycena galopus ATCC 62051]|nr:hypothetical protein K438DRAFT_1724845 [Mycena galopus ATCC 62051]
MASGNALIRWNPDANLAVATVPENSRPEGGGWAIVLKALLSPSPGRTLERVYTSIGNVLETQANRAAHTLGLGPHVIACKIKSYFGNAEERMQRLELLRITIPSKLEKKCLKLMKYTLPTEAANTQCQAFKEIIDLVTLFPGLRILLLHTKPLENARSFDAISLLWSSSLVAPNKEWTFWQTLAAVSLTDTAISAILETSSTAEFGKCHEEGLGVIERLLIEHDCTFSEYAAAVSVRYLGGVLDLPGFWLKVERVHAHVATKLCCRLVQVLKDIRIDIPLLGRIEESEAPFDYDGLDILATKVLSGISSWFAKIEQADWSVQPWYESFTKVLQLLRAPRAAELLPHSYDCASNAFENIVPTTFHNLELHVMVNSQNTASENQPPEDDCLTDLQCKTSSVHSNTSDNKSTHSTDECNTQYSSRDSLELSIEDDRSSGMTDLSDPDTVQMDSASEVFFDCEDTSELDFEYDSNLVGELNPVNTEIRPISGGPGVLNVTSYHSLADQWQKDADKWRAILQQRQRDLGENHLETLDAMESLAWVQHELGEYKSASDLRAVVLEKRRSLLGNDDPVTLHVMRNLASTYISLGQSQQSEGLLLIVLDWEKEVLGEHHPDTLQTTMELAKVYQILGQWKRAEGLQILTMEKQRALFGENNVDTVAAMRGLALTYHYQGKYNKAQELCASALQNYREMLGEDHPNTLETMSHLARTYDGLGWHKESEQLRQIVLQKRRILLGEDHPNTLTAMAELASTYTMLGQLENAQSLLIMVLKKDKDLLGEDHPDTLRTMSHLVNTYVQLGQFSTAEELALVALKKHQKVLGEDHPSTLGTMGELAWTYQMQGRFDHAEELYVVLFEQQSKLLGDDHPAIRWTMWRLAETYRGLNKLQDAKELERLLEVKSTGHED